MFFGLSTILMTSVHLLAMTMSTCMLPEMVSLDLEDIEKQLPEPEKRHRIRLLVQVCWILSNSVGMGLFFIQLVAIAWCKFWEVGTIQEPSGKWVALVSTITLIVYLIVFAALFWAMFRKLNGFLREREERKLINIYALY
ncbi:Protein orai-2 [Halotydeus destructor]|nr:Protein orai-2 [Halotydeus destructor]